MTFSCRRFHERDDAISRVTCSIFNMPDTNKRKSVGLRSACNPLLVPIRVNHLYALHGTISLLTDVLTHAIAARVQLFSARRELLPNAPLHRGPVYPHPRMLEGQLQCMCLECVWRDLRGPYSPPSRRCTKFTVSGDITYAQRRRPLSVIVRTVGSRNHLSRAP